MRSLRSLMFFLSLLGLAHGADTVTIETPQGACQPQVCIDANDAIQLAFGADDEVFYTCSTDGGRVYRKPVQVGKLDSLALGMRRGPRIAVAGRSIVIAAIGGLDGQGRDGDLFTWRSEDEGKTWQGPVQANDVETSAREGLHGLAAGSKGNFFAVWLDLRDKGTQIFGSRSSDGGKSWSKNLLVYKSPDGSVCECCHPSVVFEGNTVYVMWRNSLGGNRDLFLATSHDLGETFDGGVKLGQDSWALNGCPMDGGAITVSPQKGFAAAWRRDKDVFLTQNRPLDEQRLGVGMQPWIAADRDQLYVVWQASRSGDVLLATSTSGAPTKVAAGGKYPVVAAGATRPGPVIVAWEAGEQRRRVIKARVISMDGR